MNTYVASHLKEMNRQRVYQLIKTKGKTSKAELSKLTGISAPTVMKIVNYLIDKGLVIEIGEAETAIGRRPHILQINTGLMYAACFVLEGDFLTMGIADILGNVIYQKNVRVKADYAHVMECIYSEYVDLLLKGADVDPERLFGIGIALPVIYNKDKNSVAGTPLLDPEEERFLAEDMERLADKYHALVMVENDVNAQTIGEYHSRTCETRDLLFISVGTGLGAGLIIDGKLRRGSHFMCGEIGHTILEPGSECTPEEQMGWLENKIGNRRIEKEFDVAIIGAQKELLKETKQKICCYMAKSIALCIHNINACLDCANIVLGGKMVEALGESLLTEVNSYLKKLGKSHTEVYRQQSDQVGMRGLAWLLANKKIKEILAEEDEG